MPKLSLIGWRDIPSQVIVKRGREAAKVLLSQRFQEAIDRAAMRAGRGSSDAYLSDWTRTEARECGPDIEAEARAEADRIEAAYDDERLLALIRAHGRDPSLAAPGEGAAADAGASGADAPSSPVDPEPDPAP